MRKNTMASRYCRFASKYCRIAGVAPLGSENTGEDIVRLADWQESRSGEYNKCSMSRKAELGSSGARSTILALDTTTRAGSVAVVQERRVLAEIPGNPELTHGQRLPGELVRTLDAAGVPLGKIDLLAVAAGPGSFTGLRV